MQENDFFLNLSSPLVNYFLIQFVFHNFNRLVLNLLFHQLFMLIELKKKKYFLDVTSFFSSDGNE